MKVYTSAYSIQFSEFTIFITLLVSSLFDPAFALIINES